MPVSPFVIDVPEDVLVDLRARLAATRWPDAIYPGWEAGVATDYLRDVVTTWQTTYDWRNAEARLNTFDHFTTTIDGQIIHFIRQPSQHADAVPVLMLHGWPSSFVQMLPILPLLADGAGTSVVHFDVIVASLPGFGFSSPPASPGMSVGRIGDLMHRLMHDELGYSRYAVRASDLGAGVAAQMALAYPEALVGIHTGGTNPWIM